MDDSTPASIFARYFVGHVRQQFYGAAPALEDFVANFRRLGLERFFPKPMIFYDVGAGVWDDDCLVVDMIRVFGCDSVRITAFEALRANFALFVGFLNNIPEAHEALATGCVIPVMMAVGNRTERMKIYGRGRLASLTYKDVYRRDMDGAEEEVAVTSIDDWLAQDAAGRIDFLKVDVEGAEWAVIEGALASLRNRRVTLIVLEYGHFWSRHSWEAANLGAQGGGKPIDEMMWPTMRSFVSYARALGYEAYLFGTPYLLPITGMYWHDVYEVCNDPHSMVYRGIFGWCWFDIALVDMTHPLSEQIHQHFVPWHLLKDGKRSYRWGTDSRH